MAGGDERVSIGEHPIDRAGPDALVAINDGLEREIHLARFNRIPIGSECQFRRGVLAIDGHPGPGVCFSFRLDGAPDRAPFGAFRDFDQPTRLNQA